jgi:hypothetical protein
VKRYFDIKEVIRKAEEFLENFNTAHHFTDLYFNKLMNHGLLDSAGDDFPVSEKNGSNLNTVLTVKCHLLPLYNL